MKIKYKVVGTVLGGILVAAVFLHRAQTIEISLDSLGQSTKVAYVDMHRVFEAFPQTQKEREELVRLIEEKKAEITVRKEQIAFLKGQISFLKKTKDSLEPSTDSAKSRVKKRQEEAVEKELDNLPESATGLSLPDESPLSFLFSPPDSSSATDTKSTPDASSVSISTEGPMILPGVPSPQPQLADKEKELSLKQADLEAFVGATELEIKNLEEGKTMVLMAQIYQALTDIAKKDGYTILFDKSNILYGENIIDITDQVIWRLTNARERGLFKR